MMNEGHKMNHVTMTYTYDENIVSDLHKDAYGFRPLEGFWRHWNESTMDQKQVIWDKLLRDLDREIEAEKKRHEMAIAEFEDLIRTNISCGAGDRETAIRWIVDSLDLSETDKMYGGEYVCYLLGLPYSMEKEFV